MAGDEELWLSKAVRWARELGCTRMQVVAYYVLLGAVFGITFYVLSPHLPLPLYPFESKLPALVHPLALALSHGVAARSDAGTSIRDLHAYAYDNILYVHPRLAAALVRMRHRSVFCTACERAKPARARHCTACARCVSRSDHHCAWLNNCVGRRNLRFFLLFLALHTVSLAYAATLAASALLRLLRSPHPLRNAARRNLQRGHLGAFVRAAAALVWNGTRRKLLVLLGAHVVLASTLAALLVMAARDAIARGATPSEVRKWHTVLECARAGTLRSELLKAVGGAVALRERIESAECDKSGATRRVSDTLLRQRATILDGVPGRQIRSVEEALEECSSGSGTVRFVYDRGWWLNLRELLFLR